MKYLYCFQIIIGCSFTLWAQNTLRPNIYFQNMHYYNAAVGISDTSAIRSFAFYAKDKFVSKDNDVVWNKPVNIYLNHIYKPNQKNSFNVSYIYDGYSFYSRNTLYTGYTRVFSWGKSQKLSIGGRAIFNLDKINWDKLGQIKSKPSSGLYFTPDFDLGGQYQLGGLILGVSTKNLFANSVNVDGEELIKNWRELYINASYTHALFDQNLKISPYILYLRERDVELDAGLNLTLFKTVDLSYAFRIFELRSIYVLKLTLPKRIQVGAAVDHSSIFSDTNVDVLVGYSF